MMIIRYCSLLIVILAALSGACAAIGRTANIDHTQNGQPTDTPQASGGLEAKAEIPAGQHTATMFRGSVADAKVEMEIKRDGSTLSGSYFYLRSGSTNRLTIKGTVDDTGNFKILESDAAGEQTGLFQGKWKEDPNESGASLEGEWLKPGQRNDGKPFYAWEQMLYFSSTSLATGEIKEAIKPKNATLTAEYPQLSGGANPDAFNQIAKAQVTRSLAGFKKDLAGMTADDIKMMGEMGTYIEVGYNVEYADDDLISVNFGEDSFLGGAHPNHGTFTLTYDLKQGRELKLADLFKPGSKYLATIADYTMRDLKGRKDPESGENLGLASDIFEDGAKPTAENYTNWNLTKKGLMITFPPYQVAAYAYGPQTVIVPFSALKDIAKIDGPLSKIRK
jgi:Protein of unknown function (DUF3298)/Deacetylase PdaC